MNHIWRYLQTNQNKNVVVVCPTREIAMEVKMDILDKVKRHNILNDPRQSLAELTQTSLRFGTNRVMCVTDVFDYIELKGFTVHVLLLSSKLDETRRRTSMWRLIQQMPPRGERVISTYVHKTHTPRQDLPF